MALWITVSERPDRTYFYIISKKISVPRNFKSFLARVSADTRYILRVNGKYVCEGPCLGSSSEKYYESVDLTEYVTAGENTIELKVLHVVGHTFISAMRGEKPAFWFEGNIDGVAVNSDVSWECVRINGVSFQNFPELIPSMPPFEIHSGDEGVEPMALEIAEYPTENAYNVFGIRDKYPLKERPIPCMRIGEAVKFAILRSGDGYAELGAEKYTTAIPTFRLKGKPDDTACIYYAECANEKGVVCDVIRFPKSGEYTFTPFWFRAFRFVRMEGAFEIIDAEYVPYFYPLDVVGTFKCSDENLNRMWDVSVNTVMCCAHETFVDCPYYEQQQYGQDSCLETLFWYRMGADKKLPFKCILDLSKSQMCDGMIQANYPSTSVQIIPDFTLYWIIELREYLRYAPKDGVIENNLLGTVMKALSAFETYSLENGLVGMTPYWNFVDWVPGWDFGIPPGGREGEPLTFTSMLYCYALRAAGEIFDIFGKSNNYNLMADCIAEKIRNLCYDKDAGLFRNTPTRRDFSQHTTVMAILSGVVSDEDARGLIERTFERDGDVAKCSFSMNFFTFRALEKAGRYDLCKKVFEGWQKMLDMDCTTWCENPDNPRSKCHGWSSAPIFEFSQMVLGVRPLGNNWEAVEVRPDFTSLGLDFAEGNVPTPNGALFVSWRRTSADKYDVSVNGKTYPECENGWGITLSGL